MIYTAPCVMLLMRAASITWTSGRGLVPGNREFLGPVKWHRADRRVLFGAKKPSNAKVKFFCGKMYSLLLNTYFRAKVCMSNLYAFI
jgi:hypothetical protein